MLENFSKNGDNELIDIGLHNPEESFVTCGYIYLFLQEVQDDDHG
jgi:hypothetical protein